MSEGPLAGTRVLVTRPAEQAGALCRAVRDAGGEPVPFPVIRITPVPPGEIASALAAMPRPNVAVFVSRNAVECGLDAVRGTGARLAAVGPATAAAIEAAGGRVAIRPAGGSDSEHLLAAPALEDVAGSTIVIVRGNGGRELLADTLRARGAAVHYLPVYRRELNVLPTDRIDAVTGALERGQIGFVIALSVETLRNLLLLLGPGAETLLRKSTLVAPGERVIQGACQLVPGIAVCKAAGAAADDVVNAMIELKHSGPDQ